MKKLNQLLDDQRKILKVYAVGALFFFIGVGFIQWADKLIEPSLEQEGYVLIGILVGASGFIISMLSQILLIIHRFRKM